MNEEIFLEVRSSDNVDNLKSMLSIVSVDIVNDSGRNLLQTAIAYKRYGSAALLINSNIDINHKDKDGLTPLHFAAIYQQPEIAKLILDNGGDLSIEDNTGCQPLNTAVNNAGDETSVCELFVQYGADVDHKDSGGESPKDTALLFRNEKLMKLFGVS